MRHDIPNIIKKLIYSIKGLKVKELFLLIFPLFIHNMVQAKDADGGYILASLERIDKRTLRKTCQYKVDNEYSDKYYAITSKGFSSEDFYLELQNILYKDITVFNNQECDEKIAIHYNSLTGKLRLIAVPKNIKYSTYYYEQLNKIQAEKNERALQEQYDREYEQELAIAKRNIPIMHLNFESKNLIKKIKDASWGNRGFLVTNKAIYFNLDSSKLSTVMKSELMNSSLSCSFTLLENDTVLATDNILRFYVDDDFIMKSENFYLGKFTLDGDLIKRIQLGNVLDLSCKIQEKSSSYYDSLPRANDLSKAFKAKKRNVEVDDFRIYFRYR